MLNWWTSRPTYSSPVSANQLCKPPIRNLPKNIPALQLCFPPTENTKSEARAAHEAAQSRGSNRARTHSTRLPTSAPVVGENGTDPANHRTISGPEVNPPWEVDPPCAQKSPPPTQESPQTKPPLPTTRKKQANVRCISRPDRGISSSVTQEAGKSPSHPSQPPERSQQVRR